jgi:hypothetical protein
MPHRQPMAAELPRSCATARGCYSTGAAVELLIRARGGRFVAAGQPWLRTDDRGITWLDAEVIGRYLHAVSSEERHILALVEALALGKPLEDVGVPTCTPRVCHPAGPRAACWGRLSPAHLAIAEPESVGGVVPLGWPANNADWPVDGEPAYIEIHPNSGSTAARSWFHVQNGGSERPRAAGARQRCEREQWFVVTAERIPGNSYRWCLNGKLYKQILGPGLTPKPEEAAVTKVLSSPYNVPLDYLRWPIQFESKGTEQTNESGWPSFTGHCGNEFEGRRPRGRVRGLPVEGVAENGGIVADSAEGYRHQSCAITMAKKLNPGAQLVVDDKSEGYHPLDKQPPRRVDGLRGLQGDTSVWAQGRGCAQTDASKGVHGAVRTSGYPKPSVLTVSEFLARVACMEDGQTSRPHPSEEREEPMSVDSTSGDEQPEVDDGTLSEIVRRPTRTAGDLSEVADASPGITTEDLARDLEAVASKQGVSTDSELLADLLRRVQRIEEHLGITN